MSTSYQLDPGDPLSYVFFTDNAASGRNLRARGLELVWQPHGPGDSRQHWDCCRPSTSTTTTVIATWTAASRRTHRRTSTRSRGSGTTRAGWMARADLDRHGRVLLRHEPRPALASRYELREPEGGLVGEALVGLRLGPQRLRRELCGARLLLRPRAARLSRTNSTCSAATRASSASPSSGACAEPIRPIHALEIPMRIAVEISLYPLECGLHPADQGFHRAAQPAAGLQVVTNAMSTQVAGRARRGVRGALRRRPRRRFAGGRRAVFVMKVLGGTPDRASRGVERARDAAATPRLR